MRHGFGAFEDRHGNKYSGQWQKDERSGQGNITFVDGSSYEGNWLRGKFQGQGTLNYSETGPFGSLSESSVSKDSPVQQDGAESRDAK